MTADFYLLICKVWARKVYSFYSFLSSNFCILSSIAFAIMVIFHAKMVIETPGHTTMPESFGLNAVAFISHFKRKKRRMAYNYCFHTSLLCSHSPGINLPFCSLKEVHRIWLQKPTYNISTSH